MTETANPSLAQNATRRPSGQAALMCSMGCPSLHRIFDQARIRHISQFAPVLPVVLTPENAEHYRREAAQVEILLGTWGIPPELLTQDYLPSLRVLFYAGGSIKGFGRPLLERGVQVVTAKSANALCVAQFCLGQIILSCKGYFRNTKGHPYTVREDSPKPFIGPGLYGQKIALLGMGAVARELVRLLRPFPLKILAVDPYLQAAEAAQLGVEITTMENAFAQGLVVSNHLPDLSELKGVLDHRLFAAMRPDATFINTGRGAQVNEADLVRVATARPDLTMLLDVTAPEPPLPDSPLYDLPNIQLSSHLAGAFNEDLACLADCLLEEFERYCAGQPLRHAERLSSLDRIA